ncbi:MAG: hypothetical protein ACRECX_13545 [Methyloceanibacter sp.]|uniref:hypothetical protein n=1 Tax=Methyloceanibacter sp. TaxID=1965321 RepID=UPI003D6C7A7F
MSFGSRVVTVATLALGLFLISSPAVAECDPDTAIFEDDFEFMDPSWGEPSEYVYVEDGSLIIDGFMGQVNFLTQNMGANVCADLTIAEATDFPNSPIGLVFWWQDWDNYYAVFIWADGWVEARRVMNGETTYLFTEESLALKKGVGETNHVELTLRPKDATLFINGTEIKRFKGKQPKDGGVVGFYGISGEEAPAKFAFDNLVVSELEE